MLHFRFSIDALSDRVRLAAVGKADDKGIMPNIAFASWDVSNIVGVEERWDVEVRKQVVDNSDR